MCEGIRTSHEAFVTEEDDCCCAGWGEVPASGSALFGHSHKVLLLTNYVGVMSYLVGIFFPGVEGCRGLSRLPLCNAVLCCALPSVTYLDGPCEASGGKAVAAGGGRALSSDFSQAASTTWGGRRARWPSTEKRAFFFALKRTRLV